MPRVRFPAMEFFFSSKREGDKVGENKERDVKRGGAVVARQAHNLQVG